MTTAKAKPKVSPSPQRDRARPGVLLLALAIGPCAWIVQLACDYALASNACRPNDAPRPLPPPGGWGTEHMVLLGLNLVCLGLCLAGGALALRYWRRSHHEKGGAAPQLVEVGEGRTRFMAACAVIAAAVFALAIAFGTALPFFVPSCWRFAS
jgi:hypothetical protein